DPISQRAVVHDDLVDLCNGELHSLDAGTEMRIEWARREDEDGNIVWPFSDTPVLEKNWTPNLAGRFREIVETFAVLNPHATIHLDWFGHKRTWKATDPTWQKWKPCWPTSSHWYELRHLERLIGAYITHDRDAETDRLISDFVAEFDGLSGSRKRAKVLHETGMKRMRLSEFVIGDRFDSDRINLLLRVMQKHTRPVKPASLGLIGEDHLKARLLALGVKPESFRYTKVLGGPKCKNSQSVLDDKPSFLPSVL